MKNKFLIILFIIISLLICQLCAEEYSFRGTHYIASYKGCDTEALRNPLFLYSCFLVGIEKSGATILQHHMHKFDAIAITGTAILAESHASIHSYPEHSAVFVDLFTCGEHCDWHEFEHVMTTYLNPTTIERKVMVRE